MISSSLSKGRGSSGPQTLPLSCRCLKIVNKQLFSSLPLLSFSVWFGSLLFLLGNATFQGHLFFPEFLPFFHCSFSLPVSTSSILLLTYFACTSACCPVSFCHLQATEKGPFITLPSLPSDSWLGLAATTITYSLPVFSVYIPSHLD